MQRHCLRSIALAACFLLAQAVAAHAQPAIDLPDGKYASPAEYLTGTWTWERAQPRETRRFKFERDGGFTYENVTEGRTSHGRYETPGGKFRVTMDRSCDRGGECAKLEPPVVVEEPFTPVSADVFMSNSERWKRDK